MTYPVVIFCYNRLDCLRLTIEHLKKNALAPVTDLFIFSDGAAREDDIEKVNLLREYLKSVTGFRQVITTESSTNKGLAKSIIEGVSQVLKTHEGVIVLEDDLLTSTNFLDFMTESLEFYKNNKRVFSVSGYSKPINFPVYHIYDNYFTRRGSSWGWATWRNRWLTVDWDINDYHSFFIDHSARRKFNEMGSDMCGMLDKQMKGKINSWAIRWCYHQFKTDSYSVFPSVSKVQNIGFQDSATHTRPIQQKRFATELDTSGTKHFKFNPFVRLDGVIISQFVKQFSLATRLKYKALSLIPKQAISFLQRA